jgi:hypothetical protein
MAVGPSIGLEVNMEKLTRATIALALIVASAGCSGGEQGGGEAQPQPTPSENVPESDPAGVGGTSNQ